MGNSDTASNAQIEFTGANINSAANADPTFRLTAQHKAIFGSPTTNPSAVTMTIDAVKGLFTGTLKLKDGSTIRSVRYEGLFSDDQGQGPFTLHQLPLTKTSNVLSGKTQP